MQPAALRARLQRAVCATSALGALWLHACASDSERVRATPELPRSAEPEIVLDGEWHVTYVEVGDGLREYACVAAGDDRCALRWRQPAGATLPIRVLRGFNGASIDLSVGLWAPTNGETVRDADGRRAGVLVTECHPESIPYWIGLRPGDIVRAANGVPVRSMVELIESAEDAQRAHTPWEIDVERDGSRLGLVQLLGIDD